MEGIHLPSSACTGPRSRREFLRLGLTGLGALTWPELLRRRAQAAAITWASWAALRPASAARRAS